ncbi:MAG TPA: hypothetical protein VGN59_09280 [Acidimicrobiia bacterium]
MSHHSFVLSRRVGRAPSLTERSLPGLSGYDFAGLTLVGPFERRTIVGPWGSGPIEREAPADLRTGRRTPERVAVEVAPWAQHAVELRVRPAGRRPDRWTGRRQLRYFDHAHAAIDELARALAEATPDVPVSHPVRRSA